MNLGELIVELSADSSELEKTLERAKKKAYEAAVSIENSFNKINLEIGVDDDQLTGLNKHLNLKVEHLKQVNKYFNNNPIVVNVDDSNLTDLNQHLNLKVQHLKQVNKYFDSNPIKVNTDTKSLDELEERLGGLSSRTITITVESDLSKQLEKSLADAVKEAVKEGMSGQTSTVQQEASKESSQASKTQNVNVVASPSRAILDGIFEGLGKGFTDGLNQSIEDAVGVDIPTMTRISSNMMLRYFGVGKKAQSDPKNEKKRVEAIVTDGVKAFVQAHDSNTKAFYTNTSPARNTSTSTGSSVSTTSKVSQKRNYSAIEDDLGVDFDAAGRSASKGLLRYFGVGKKAQSDPKNEKARIEAIIRGMVDDYAPPQPIKLPGFVSKALNTIGNTFLLSVDETINGLARQSKSAISQAIRKGSQSALSRSPVQVQKVVTALFDEMEGKEGESFTVVAGKELATSAKKGVNSLLKTILPNTYGVAKDFLATGIKKTSTSTASPVLNSNTQPPHISNAVLTPDLVTTQAPVEQPLNIPVNIPKKAKKPQPELELLPIETTASQVPQQLKQHFETIKTNTLKNIDLSKQYAEATARENGEELVPLQKGKPKKSDEIKLQKEISLKGVSDSFTGINQYFNAEYKKLKSEFDIVKLTGTPAEIKATKEKIKKFIDNTKLAVQDIDTIAKQAQDAGFDKTINSDLSKVHAGGKSQLKSRQTNAKGLLGKLNTEEKKVFDKQLTHYTPLAQQLGIDIDAGLAKGVKHGSDGVSTAARQMLDDLIETVEAKMKIQSPSLVMFEIGMMIASGLFLGMQKGNSKVAVGARQLVSTVKDAVGSAKEILEPALAIGSLIPGVSTAATYGGVGLAASDSGLKMLDKVGERHAANPTQTLFQSAFESGKDFITELKADKTLTKPREAFDHFINLSKAGAATFGVNSFTAFDAAQSGMTALLRSGATGKAVTQSHGETKTRLAKDPSLDYMTTYKAVLTEKLKDLKLTKPEIVKAIGSALKVVPTGFGTAANSVAATAGMVLADGIDALTIPRDLYRNIATKTAKGATYQQAIAGSITDLGAPTQVADAIGSFGDKHSVSLNAFARMSGNVVENISRSLVNTVAASSKVVSVSTNAVNNQVKKNMGHLPSQQPISKPDPSSVSSAAIVSGNVSPKPFTSIGGNIMKGLGKGMADSIGSVTKVMDNAGNAIQSQIKQNMGISSPSKVMIALGLMIASGLAIGIKSGRINVQGSIQSVIAVINSGVDKYKSIKQFLSQGLQEDSGNVVSQLIQSLQKDFGDNSFIGNGLNNIKQTIEDNLKQINKLFLSVPVVQNINKFLYDTEQSISRFNSRLVAKIKNVFEASNNFNDVGSSFVSAIGNSLIKSFSTLKDRIFSSLATSLSSLMSPLVNIIGRSNSFADLGVNLISSISKTLNSVISFSVWKIKNVYKSILLAILNSNDFSEFANNLFLPIKKAIAVSGGNLLKTIIDTGKNIGTSAKNIFKSFLPNTNNAPDLKLNLTSGVDINQQPLEAPKLTTDLLPGQLTGNNYNKLANLVLQLTGKTASQRQIPLLEKETDPSMAGMAGAYYRGDNKIRIHAKDYEALISSDVSKLSDDLIDTILHEMFHAIQYDFGKIKTVQEASMFSPSPTLKEMAKWSSVSEFSADRRRGKYSPEVVNATFDLELGAYSFGSRYTQQAKEALKTNTSLSQSVSGSPNQVAKEVQQLQQAALKIGKSHYNALEKLQKMNLSDEAYNKYHSMANIARDKGISFAESLDSVQSLSPEEVQQAIEKFNKIVDYINNIPETVNQKSFEINHERQKSKSIPVAKVVQSSSLEQSKLPKELQQTILSFKQTYQDISGQIKTMNLPDDIYSQAHKAVEMGHNKGTELIEVLNNIQDLSPEQANSAIEKFNQYKAFIADIPDTISKYIKPQETTNKESGKPDSVKVGHQVQQSEFFKDIKQAINKSTNLKDLASNLASTLLQAILNPVRKYISSFATKIFAGFTNTEDQPIQAFKQNLPQQIDQSLTNVHRTVSPVLPVQFQASDYEFYRQLNKSNGSAFNNPVVGQINNVAGKLKPSQDLKEIGTNLISSFARGIALSGSFALAVVTKFAKGILSAVKKVFRIASPSGEGIDTGENYASSHAIGINNQAQTAVNAARNMAENVRNAIADPWDTPLPMNPVFQQDLDLENQAQAHIKATKEHFQKLKIQDLLSDVGVNFGVDFGHEGIASNVLSSSNLLGYLNKKSANLTPLQSTVYNRLVDDFQNQKAIAAHHFAIARADGNPVDPALLRGLDAGFNSILLRIVEFSKRLGIKGQSIDELLASNRSVVNTVAYQPPRFVAPKTPVPERQPGQTDQEYSQAVKRALAEDNNNYRKARNAYNRMILGVSDTPTPKITQLPALPPVPVYAREIIEPVTNVPPVQRTQTTIPPIPDPWNDSVEQLVNTVKQTAKTQFLLPPARERLNINSFVQTQSNLQRLAREIVAQQPMTQLSRSQPPTTPQQPQQSQQTTRLDPVQAIQRSQPTIPLIPDSSNNSVQQLVNIVRQTAKTQLNINSFVQTQPNLQRLAREIVAQQPMTQLSRPQPPTIQRTSPIILPGNFVPNPNAQILSSRNFAPNPNAQIISSQKFTPKPDAQLILPVVQGLSPAIRSTHSLAQNSISALIAANKQIQATIAGNKVTVSSRFAPIPDPWTTPPLPTQTVKQLSNQMTGQYGPIPASWLTSPRSTQAFKQASKLPIGQIPVTLPSTVPSLIPQPAGTTAPKYVFPPQSLGSTVPAYTFPVNPTPKPPIAPVPPIPPTLLDQYLNLGTDLVTNIFNAVSASIRQSTLSGYASLGQVMQNAVNAALSSLADTLKQPLHQALLSQARSMLPWFLKFIPASFQLLPKLSFAIPFVGGMVLRLGNSIVKNLLENNILKEGGFLTNLLSSITRIDLSALSGTKTAGVAGFLKNIVNPLPFLIGSQISSSSLGLLSASPLYDAFSGILGLDKSVKPNPKKQAPTIEKVLQDQTKINREKALLRDVKDIGTSTNINTGVGQNLAANASIASKELVENLGNTLLNSVLNNLDIPVIPKSVIQGMIGKAMGERSGTIADAINAFGTQKSKAEQLLEKTVQSGRTDVSARADILTKQILRERGVTESVRNAMTPEQLAAAREKITKSPIDLTARERKLLRFMGDFESHAAKMGNDVATRKRDAMAMSVLQERGMSRAERKQVQQSQGGQGLSSFADNLRDNPRTGGFMGRFTEAYASNDQDAMKELVKQGLRKAGMSTKQINNIDPKLLDTATAGLMTTLSGLQAKFREKGFDMGKALAKGLKDSMVNLANAKDDLEYNAKKALGQANFGDSVGLIFRRMFRGTAATQSQFTEMYNQMGSGVKNLLFKDRSQGDEMFPNVLQFFGSIATTLAPITTMIGAITPLLLPLAPIITGIGMAVNMVAPHVAKLIDGIQRVEVLQRRFKFLGGSTEGGKAEFNYAKDIANKLNVPSEVAANSYSQLAIAAKDSKMEGQGVKELFEGITSSLSALGINGQDASLVFMAYTQILAKGKLSMEELRQQLGEKFPPAMAVFAKAMGVSVPEMNALVASGGILSQDILPKVAKVLKEDYGNAAANQAGGLVVALNKLGNVGFEITTIFTDKLGGTLAFFVNSFANILGVLSGALKDLIPLAQSFMIGFAATISIGLTIILSKFKPFLVVMTSLQSFLLATFSAITTNMMPMVIGVMSDVADGWLGAEKNLMDNMFQGISNMFVTVFGTIDSVMRSMSNNQFSFSSMFGGLIQGAQQAGNIMEWLKGVFAGFFKIIPSGLVELLAIVFMLEQGTGLMVVALWPAIKGLWGGITGIFGATAKAFYGVMGTIKSVTELMMTSSAVAGNAMNDVAVRNARSMAIVQGGLAFLSKALLHFSIGYAALMFSKGDFSDPMRESINKSTADINRHLTDVRLNINKTTEAFNKATKSVEELGNGIANALPSKGVQLDIRSLWGGGDWKWDDAVRETNAKYRTDGKGGSPQGPSAMDVIGTGALYAGGAGYGYAAGAKAAKAIVDLAVKAGPILASNAALGSAAGPRMAVPLFGRLATAIAPVVAIMGPWGLAIAGLVAAIGLATVALDLFAPKITEAQLNNAENQGGLPPEIKQIINAKKEGERLDLASQQVIKLYNDQKLNNERLREFANSAGLDGNPNNFVAPRATMSEKQRKEFEDTDKVKNINTDIENKRKSLKAIEDNADTEVEKSAARSGDPYKKVQAELAQLEKNKKLMQLNFMANYGNKSKMDAIDKQIEEKEKEIADHRSTYKYIDTRVGIRDPENRKQIAVREGLKEELENLKKQKATLQTNIGASAQRRLNYDEIKNIDARLKKAATEFVDLQEQLRTNPSSALRSKAGTTRELIKQLQKQREGFVDSFGDITPALKRSIKDTKDKIAEIQTKSDVPEAQRKVTTKQLRETLNQLEKMLATANQFSIAEISESMYTQATNALKDAETKYNANMNANKIASNLSQSKIYNKTNLTSQQIAPELSKQQIKDLETQQSELNKSLTVKESNLKNLNVALALGVGDMAGLTSEIEKLQQDIMKDKEQISQNVLEIAKARREANQALIDQTKQVAEYYRTNIRESELAVIEYKKAIVSIKNLGFANRLRQALIGAGTNIVTEFVEGLINIFQQLGEIENIRIDQERQKLEYRNSITDMELKMSELQRSIPGLDPSKLGQFNQSLKGIGGTLLDIGKEIERINKMLGVDVVNSTNGLNMALTRVSNTFSNLNSMPSIVISLPGNPNTPVPPSLFVPGDPITPISNPKKPNNDLYRQLGIPTKQSELPAINPTAIASMSKGVLVAGIASDVPYLPPQPQLVAQALPGGKPKNNKPKPPDNAIVSPIDGMNISEFNKENYSVNSDKKITIYGGETQKLLSSITGSLLKVNANTVEVQKKINGRLLKIRYEGLDIDKNIKFGKDKRASITAGQVLGTQDGMLEGSGGVDVSVTIDGIKKNPSKFFRDAVEGKRRNPITRFGNWFFDEIDPDTEKLGLVPQNVSPSWLKKLENVSPSWLKNLGRGAWNMTTSVFGFGKRVAENNPGSRPNQAPIGPVKKPYDEQQKRNQQQAPKTTKKTTPKTTKKTTKKTTPKTTPTKTLQNTARELTEKQIRGQTLDPKTQQRLIPEASTANTRTKTQLTKEQIRLSKEQERSTIIRALTDLRKLKIETENKIADTDLRTRRGKLNTRKMFLDSDPAATEQQKFDLAYAEESLRIDEEINNRRKIVRASQMPNLSGEEINNLVKRLQSLGIKTDGKELQKLYSALQSSNTKEAQSAQNQLNALVKNKPIILQRLLDDFKIRQKIAQNTRTSDNLGIDIGVLQSQLELLKQIEKSFPLNKDILQIPSMERIVAIVGLQNQKLKSENELLEQQRTKRGTMTKEDFERRRKAIETTYKLGIEKIDMQYNTDNLAKQIEREINALDVKILIEDVGIKNLDLQAKMFAATAADGMVDVANISKRATLEQESALNRLNREILDTQNNTKLTAEQRQQRIDALKVNSGLELGAIRKQSERDTRKGELQNQKAELDAGIKVSDSAKTVLEGKGNLAKALGLELAGERIDKQIAQINLNHEYAQKRMQLKQDIENMRISNENAIALRENLDAEMALKSEAIKIQYSEFSQVLKSFTGGFKSALKEFIWNKEGSSWADSLDKLWKGISNTILDSLAEIASKYMTDALFNWIQPPAQNLNTAALQLQQAAASLSAIGSNSPMPDFPGMAGSSVLSTMGLGNIDSFSPGDFDFSSFDFDALGSADFGSLDLSGFAKGGMIDEDTLGKIQNFANGGIVGAMNKERSLTGRTPHLVVASEGERILNHRETAIWNRLQSGITGFADGGIVGGGKGEMASRIGNTTTVNVPVSVSVSGNDSEVDSARLAQTVEALVSDGIRRQLRPGGSISRGNPYKR